jgi:hypothetical protein
LRAMVVLGNREVEQKGLGMPAEANTAPTEARAVKRSIAGARPLQLHAMRDAFWERSDRVA